MKFKQVHVSVICRYIQLLFNFFQSNVSICWKICTDQKKCFILKSFATMSGLLSFTFLSVCIGKSHKIIISFGSVADSEQYSYQF